MKYTILLTICLGFSTSTMLFSQVPVPASCKYKHLTYYAEKGENLTHATEYTIYLVKDSLQQRIDTVGKYGYFLDNELCVCTDTSVVFYKISPLENQSIRYFYFNDHKWNRTHPYLPENDLRYVGVIITGKEYKSYNHRLITPEKAVSDMKIKKGVEIDMSTRSERLILVGNYEVEFVLSPDKERYVVSKETLKKR